MFRTTFLAFQQLCCEVFFEVFAAVNDDLVHFPLPLLTGANSDPTCFFSSHTYWFSTNIIFAGIAEFRVSLPDFGEIRLFFFARKLVGTTATEQEIWIKPRQHNRWHPLVCKCVDKVARSKFMFWRAHETKRLVPIQCPNMVNSACSIRELYFWWNMEVLAGYDSSSSDENAKIQPILTEKQVRNAVKRSFYMAAMLLSCFIVCTCQKSREFYV